jgi:hypothetical protein
MGLHRDRTGFGREADRDSRLAGLLAFTGTGATLTIVLAAVQWPVVAPLAPTAIVSVGTITAGALAVLASVNRRRA